MKLILLFIIGFITPVLVINPMTKREKKISLTHALYLFIGSVICYFALILILSFFQVPLDKTEANRLLIGTFSGTFLALCLTNYEVWDYLIPAIKFITQKILASLKFLVKKFEQYNKENDIKKEITDEKNIQSEIHQEKIKHEDQIKPITRKEKSINDILDKLDRF